MSNSSLSSEHAKKLDEFLKTYYEDGTIPAVMAGVTTADKELYFGRYGDRRLGEADAGAVDDQTILQLFSMTKLVTAVAVMQQVEKGLLTLDDPDVVDKYCPEIKEFPICEGYGEDGKAIIVKPKNRVTLRMLLDHTSGMCYDFTAPWLARYKKEHGIGERVTTDATIESFKYPLKHEPGTAWTYSIGLDWAGFLLERLLGKSLEEIFKENIFAKCGGSSLTFYPPKDKSHLFGMCTRKDGKLVMADVAPYPRAMEPEDMKICCGGSGLFGTARDYLTFLRHLLASANGGEGALLSPDTFKLMFTNSIDRTPVMRKTLAYFARGQRQYDPSFVENDEAEHITFGLSLLVCLKESGFGRKAGSGSWDGAAKTMFWLDPAAGVAGVYCTNLFVVAPDVQDPFLRTYNEYERLVYDSLEA